MRDGEFGYDGMFAMTMKLMIEEDEPCPKNQDEMVAKNTLQYKKCLL